MSLILQKNETKGGIPSVNSTKNEQVRAKGEIPSVNSTKIEQVRAQKGKFP